MKRLGVVLAVLVTLAGSGCSNDNVKAGEVSVVVDPESRVLVAERGAGLRLAEGRRTLHVGAQVKVLTGSASITLDDGARLEVRKGSEVQVGSPVSLVAQDLLVTSGTRPVKVSAAGSQVTVAGVAQVSRDLAVSAATYRGTATLQSAARSLVIPALREAAVPSLGVLRAEALAIDYDPADAWDRRYLGAAIDLGEELEAKSEGFTRSLDPAEGHTPGFYRLLLPELEGEPAFGEDLLSPGLEPGDALVGATIAVNGQIGSFASRWASVFAFRELGAKWGLVALDQQVRDIQGLVGAVDAAIGRQSFAFAPAPVPSVRANVTPPPPTPSTPSAPAAAGPRAPSPQPTTPTTPPSRTPPTTAPLITVPQLLPDPDPGPDPPPPTEGLLTPLLDVVTTTLDGLLSGD